MSLRDVTIPTEQFRVGMWPVIVENFLPSRDIPERGDGQLIVTMVDMNLLNVSKPLVVSAKDFAHHTLNSASAFKISAIATMPIIDFPSRSSTHSSDSSSSASSFSRSKAYAIMVLPIRCAS